MSHKNKKYGHAMIQREDSKPLPQKTNNINTVQSETRTGWFSSITGTLRNNLGLIATIGAGCAGATFLLATQTGRNLGRSVTSRTSELVTDGANRLSEIVTDNVSRASDFVAGRGTEAFQFLRSKLPLSAEAREELREQSEFDEKIHQLQEHFKRPAA